MAGNVNNFPVLMRFTASNLDFGQVLAGGADVRFSEADYTPLSYYIEDWDDGSDSGWQGPYQSGIIVEGSHSWGEKGYFKVRVKSRDRYGVESEFSDALFVKVGQGKSKSLMKQCWFITIFWKMLDLPLFIRVIDFI